MPLKSRMLFQTLDAIDSLDSSEGSSIGEIIRFIQQKLKIKGREAHPSIITLVRHALYKGVQLGLLCQHGQKYFRYKKYDDMERSSSDSLIPKDAYESKTETSISTAPTSESEAITDSTVQQKDKCPKRKRVRKFKVCYRRKRKNRRRKKRKEC